MKAPKGVVCHFYEDDEAPVDENGNMADLIMDGVSASSARMNPGRIFHANFGSIARDDRQRLINLFRERHGDDYLFRLSTKDVDEGIAYIRDLYSMINNESVMFIDGLDHDQRHEFLVNVLEDWLNIFYPLNNDRPFSAIHEAVENSVHRPHLGKIQYKDGLGRLVSSHEDIRIERSYFLLLDRNARDYSGVSSARVNTYMLPIKGGSYDKHRYPHSRTPIANVSETEGRIFISNAGPKLIAELMDLAANPTSHMAVIRNIYESPLAFDVNYSVDRSVIPYGKTKPALLFKHMFRSNGIGFEYKEYPLSNDGFEFEDHHIPNERNPLLDTMYLPETLSDLPLPSIEGEYNKKGTLKARNILNMSRYDLWKLPFGSYDVIFEDGVTQEMSVQSIQLDRYCWEMYLLYPDAIIKHHCSSTNVVGDGYFNGKVISSVLERIFKDLCLQKNIRSYIDKEPMMKMALEVENLIFNELAQNISQFNTTIRSEHIIDLVNSDEVQEIQGRINGTPDSIDRSYRELGRFYRSTEMRNPLVDGIRYGAVNQSQGNQIIGSPGFISDLDRKVFPKPVLTGFGMGMSLLYDMLIETRTAAKANIASSQSIRDTEWASRRFQQLTMSVEYAIVGDCGSTQLEPMAVKEAYLQNYRGVWYSEEEHGELKCMEGNEKHLDGNIIYVRTPFGCKLPNRHNICTTCLGKTFENLKPNTNIGYTAAGGFMKDVSQKRLSFKHLVESVSGNNLALSEAASEYFYLGEGSAIYVRDDIDLSDLNIVLDGTKLIKLTDAIHVKETDIPMSRMGDLEIVHITNSDESLNYAVRIASGDREANITKHLLDYIKSVDFETNRRGNYSVPLREWDTSVPMFEIPLKEEDLGQFLSLLESYVEGTVTGGKGRTFKQHFEEFVKLIFDSSKCNISVLFVLGYALTVNDLDNRDYRLARNSSNINYAKASEIFLNRSMSQFLVYQDQLRPLYREAPTLFNHNNRQKHAMDVLFFPQEVVDAYDRDQELYRKGGKLIKR